MQKVQYVAGEETMNHFLGPIYGGEKAYYKAIVRGKGGAANISVDTAFSWISRLLIGACAGFVVVEIVVYLFS